MKKIMGILVFMIIFCTSSLAFADDWTYAGRFVLRYDMPHSTDVFIMNHLVPYSSQAIGTTHGKYMPYDVYYQHDHSTDRGGGAEYANWHFEYNAKVVPLNIYGAPMDYSGLHSGSIVTSYVIATKGSYGIIPKTFRVYDRKSHEVLFEARGTMGSEELHQNSAAEVILQQSAPHPVERGTSDKLKGHGYYAYS